MEQNKDSNLQLAEEIAKLSKAIEKSNSFWRALIQGIVRSVGMVLGATIITALVFALLWKTVQTMQLDKLIPSLIPSMGGSNSQLPSQDFIQQLLKSNQIQLPKNLK